MHDVARCIGSVAYFHWPPGATCIEISGTTLCSMQHGLADTSVAPHPANCAALLTFVSFLCLWANFSFVRVGWLESHCRFTLVHLAQPRRACSHPRAVLRIGAVGEGARARLQRHAADR